MEALILSYALDTNGQNARFVRASERWGKDKRVLKALAIGNQDPAGVVGRYQIAADRLNAPLVIRSVHRTQAYFDFPSDIAWIPKNHKLIRQLIEQADVIHLNNSTRAAKVLGIRKPTLLHHHGSLFRNNTRHMLQTARMSRMAQAVSTIDLTEADPEVLHWLPTAYDVNELQAFGKTNRREPDGRVRIVHAPTNRSLKGTDLLIQAVRELQDEGLPVDLVLVEGMTWAECMTIKATADILFDQIMFGYGCNAVEAWGMGIPVIAGGEPWTMQEMTRRWGRLPFVEATEDTLKARLRELVESADLRVEYGSIGLAHVRKYHDEKPALAKLAELYALALKTFTSGRRIPSKMPAVTFMSKTGRPVSLPTGERVEFQAGEAKVTDPDLINRLRYFAAKRPAFGISEKVA